MNISTLSRLFVAFIATICVASAMAQEPTKTTNKTSTTKTSAATASNTTKPAFDPGTTPDNVFYKTDPSFWDHGIARMWAGFYVRFTSENIKQYLFGNTVVFANGEKRKIIGSSVNGDGAWDVRVEGDKLDFTKVGSPSKFKVELAKPAAPAAAAVTPAAATTKNSAAKKAAPTTAPKKASSK